MAICNNGFILDSRSAAYVKGMPGLRTVSSTIPPECSVAEQIESGVDAVLDDIIAALTKPLTDEEKSPQAKGKAPAKEPRIAFTGSLEEVNRYFYKKVLSDGLPIFPPTEEAVAEMLTGTDLPPDHLVGKIPSRFGNATVEKIAINAVMAGALPTYMPLIIAGVEAMADPISNLGWVAVGTGSHTPCWIVNGPVRKDLQMNSGTGYLSPGNMANATIGRALTLIIRNIGGNRKGIEDMGVHGHPGKYTMVVAENEEDSPWEPLHVEEGLPEEDSAVSFFSPDCYIQYWPYGTSEKGILNALIYNIIPARWGTFCVMLPPVHAHTLARGGWTKKILESYISEYATVLAYQHPDFNGEPRTGGNRGEPKLGRMPLKPNDTVRILFNPDWIRVVVAGGAGNYIGVHQSGGGFLADWVTRKVQLPKNWKALVEKYQDVVPEFLSQS